MWYENKKILPVYMDKELYAEIKKIANENNESMSKVVNKLLKVYIETYKNMDKKRQKLQKGF